MGHIRNIRHVWDSQRGRLYPVPAGAEGDGDPPANNGGGDGGGGDEPLQFTQTQLNAMMAREKNQGRQAAQQELADQLGVPLEEAKAILTAAREREDAEKSEAQRAKDEADRKANEAAQAAAEAARERHETRVERALIRAGVDPDDEARLADLARLVTSAEGADLETITTDVTAVKERYPELFGAGDGGGNPPPPSSDPRGRPPVRKGSEDAMSRGAERAKKFGRKSVQYNPASAGSL